MKTKLILAAILLLSVIGLIYGNMAVAAQEDSQGVRAALAGFYAALNELFTGEVGPMKAVWSHQDDVTYLGPDGSFRVGWQQVLTDWEKQAAMKLGGNIEPEKVHITVGRDLAVVSNYEVGTSNPENQGPQKVSIRATNVFRKENGQWKMIGHHADVLPFLED